MSIFGVSPSALSSAGSTGAMPLTNSIFSPANAASDGGAVSICVTFDAHAPSKKRHSRGQHGSASPKGGGFGGGGAGGGYFGAAEQSRGMVMDDLGGDSGPPGLPITSPKNRGAGGGGDPGFGGGFKSAPPPPPPQEGGYGGGRGQGSSVRDRSTSAGRHRANDGASDRHSNASHGQDSARSPASRKDSARSPASRKVEPEKPKPVDLSFLKTLKKDGTEKDVAELLAQLQELKSGAMSPGATTEVGPPGNDEVPATAYLQLLIATQRLAGLAVLPETPGLGNYAGHLDSTLVDEATDEQERVQEEQMKAVMRHIAIQKSAT
eukprot:TRINITY_DN40084_c0_g1_i4.p1 TRINITY_DN40084_c0_g1~~TRINITY_DN40084_c0_g1_i4.p1  ORF type:complete len:322 (+),score=67.66 TRINITY_DN40084_c0_g1_i4:92-1057(+)